MKILFVVPYPSGDAASQRFRFEQYYDILRSEGFTVHISSFYSSRTWSVIYKPGKYIHKFMGMLSGYFRRIRDIFSIASYDFIFIHRETSPFGFPLLAWLAAYVFRKKIIYDFDDAIWIPNVSEYNTFMYYLKRFNNVSTLCRLAYKVSCGNDYLCAYASGFNKNVYLIPTVIDTDNYHNIIKKYDESKTVIGWTGSHSTLKYLDEIYPVLKALEDEGYHFEFRVISDQAPAFSLRSLKFIPWRKESEVEDLAAIDVGLMPLPDDDWAKGKCGFKALQYMSIGIPAMVSPVGVNTLIVDHGVNGFVCRHAADWKKYLKQILDDKSLLLSLSKATRPKIVERYSVNANKDAFMDLFSDKL